MQYFFLINLWISYLVKSVYFLYPVINVSMYFPSHRQHDKTKKMFFSRWYILHLFSFLFALDILSSYLSHVFFSSLVYTSMCNLLYSWQMNTSLCVCVRAIYSCAHKHKYICLFFVCCWCVSNSNRIYIFFFFSSSISLFSTRGITSQN